jgi:DNA-directed RNA polymerase specialized sigma24 family protein
MITGFDVGCTATLILARAGLCWAARRPRRAVAEWDEASSWDDHLAGIRTRRDIPTSVLDAARRNHELAKRADLAPDMLLFPIADRQRAEPKLECGIAALTVTRRSSNPHPRLRGTGAALRRLNGAGIVTDDDLSEAITMAALPDREWMPLWRRASAGQTIREVARLERCSVATVHRLEAQAVDKIIAAQAKAA